MTAIVTEIEAGALWRQHQSHHTRWRQGCWQHWASRRNSSQRGKVLLGVATQKTNSLQQLLFAAAASLHANEENENWQMTLDA